MSLYHEAAEVLTKLKTGDGSLKTAVFGKKTWKSDAKTLFALCAEAAKWSTVLSEVVEKSGILKLEKNLTPELALLLTHDLLLAKQGIRLPAKHGLHVALSRHKARLSAELTKARLRRGHATLEALREHVNVGSATPSDGPARLRQPRWIRVNTLRSSLDEELQTTFAEYDRVDSLAELMRTPAEQSCVYVDAHIPDLLAVVGTSDPSKLRAYRAGKLIFQEKASCFPAYLLSPGAEDRHVIDACAAPGNKTTHLAAQLHSRLTAEGKEGMHVRVAACEKDPERSKTLAKMVALAGAEEIVVVKPKQDFLRLDYHAKEYADVTALLLDPSCSGSGILNRDEGTYTVHLPSTNPQTEAPTNGKKRKRGKDAKPPPPEPQADVVEEEAPEQPAPNESVADLATRLQTLATFQLRLLQHAMHFPAARRITYSTCSIHDAENEHVIARALASEVAKARGWRIMLREEQPAGMKAWSKRGRKEAVLEVDEGAWTEREREEIAEGCIRSDKRGEDGTMGFFVAGLVRDGTKDETVDVKTEVKHAKQANGQTEEKRKKQAKHEHNMKSTPEEDEDDDEDEWNGFGDD